jgi:hypothetical protein
VAADGIMIVVSLPALAVGARFVVGGIVGIVEVPINVLTVAGIIVFVIVTTVVSFEGGTLIVLTCAKHRTGSNSSSKSKRFIFVILILIRSW